MTKPRQSLIVENFTYFNWFLAKIYFINLNVFSIAIKIYFKEVPAPTLQIN